jgi:hypothetical protein
MARIIGVDDVMQWQQTPRQRILTASVFYSTPQEG